MVPEILIADGPLKGQRFTVAEGGSRLGRSTTCEIAVPDDMSLSRNHCLLELVDGVLCITDLASANGTEVNGESVGSETVKLKIGDIITAGDTVLRIVEPGGGEESVTSIDLGFGEGDVSTGDEVSDGKKASLLRLAMWAVTLVIMVATVWFIMGSDSVGGDENVREVKEVEKPKLLSFAFEKVEASENGIYRYALSMGADGEMKVEIDDLPNENRHIRKSQKLSPEALDAISRMLVPGFSGQSREENETATELFRLEKEYTGTPPSGNDFISTALKVTTGDKVFSVDCQNTRLPPPLASVCDRLETFSKNELGMWAIQYSAEKLIELSEESRNAAKAKWEERDVQHGNLAASLALYNEAVFYLETINPKPENYGELCRNRDEVKEELEKRYRDQRFLADRAINLGDWETALKELRILCQLIPDKKDPRNEEASKKLIDVESRIGKGGSK